MYRLDNVVQPYAWGSRTAIADLLGMPSPSSGPQAELWLGAHASAPSRLVDHSAGTEPMPLDSWIALQPRASLGPEVLARLGPRLPFLLKVLAAETPLSLQAHPDATQAVMGFAAEEEAGVTLSAPHRNYKDPSHKPELLVALTPFSALCGFRPLAESITRFRRLGQELVAGRLEHDGLGPTFAWVMGLSPAERAPLVESVVTACSEAKAGRSGHLDPDDALAFGWAGELARLYPGDIWVVVALLLHVVELSPGEGIYLPARRLHAYLRGVGVEIMASSDNVLRGGLTPKHVDVPELMRVLEFHESPSTRVLPRTVPPPSVPPFEQVYDTEAAEFRLSRLLFSGDGERAYRVAGPEIWLCVDGEVTLTSKAKSTPLTLTRGQSVFVPASDAEVSAAGSGVIFRARDGLAS